MAKHYFLGSLAERSNWLARVAWRIEAWAIGAFFWLLGRLSPERAVKVAYRVFAWIGPKTPKRKRAYRNLKTAFPDRSEAEIERYVVDIFGHLGVAVAELVHTPRLWREREQRFEFVVEPGVTFLERGKPAVLLTAHVGAWSFACTTAGHFNFPATIVYAPESNPYVHDLVYKIRSALPVRLIKRDNAMRDLVRELSHGRSVGFASDVRLDAGEPVPMFGHEMLTNTVPARLALRYDCELVPVRVERLPNVRFRVTICSPIEKGDPSVGIDAQARAMSTRLNSVFEQWIRATPGEWVCLARRWPKEVERAAAGMIPWPAP